MKTVPTLVALLILCQGCALLPDGWGTEVKHDSATFAGQPFEGPTFIDKQGRKRPAETTVDVWNTYLYWDRGTWYAELGEGVLLRDGGFYIREGRPPLITNGRFGKRFSF